MRDPVWQFVGAILALLAILISIWIYLAQRKTKVLGYKIVSEASVLSANDEISGKLQILFQDNPVKNVFLVVVNISNAGNIPISSKDYERDICFIFSRDVKILTVEIAESQPENLGAEISIAENNVITLKPLLLNSGDAITIKALISEYKPYLKVDGRIIGVSNIKKLAEGVEPISAIVFIASLVTMVISAILEINYGEVEFWKLNNPASQVLVVIGYVLMFITVFINRKKFNILRRLSKTRK